MSFLEVAGRRLTIPQGDSFVGSDAAAAVVLAAPEVLPRHAILQSTGDGQVVVRRAEPRADILINGVRLGDQPTPLLHGDKMEIGGQELLFVDERRSGSTQYIQAVNPATLAGGRAAGAPRVPTAATGGRLVSLTDGREYAVERSLVMGRDASCEVVITSKDVSRRHAEIVQTPQGYVIADSSTNGTFVNGQRVHGQLVLSRTDVIRMGEHEFRFYADTPPAEPVAPSAEPKVESAPPAARRLANTLFGVKAAPPPGPAARSSGPTPPPPRATPRPPVAPPSPTPPPATRQPTPAAPAVRPSGQLVLAHLVIRSGVLKGQRLPVRTTLANIGRADYNDLVLPDDSVSTVHAKLQLREGIWMIVDLNSTNGTFVDGERVPSDAPLAPGSLLRFGEVRAFFEPVDADMPTTGGSTKVIQALRLPNDGQ
jgi:pSer/pThr/pTyr-binding forkhead associated (FHA) protein